MRKKRRDPVMGSLGGQYRPLSEDQVQRIHQAALSILETVIDTETREVTEKSENSVSALSDKYYLPTKSTEPTVFVVLTDNWITMIVRYITEVRQRRIFRNRLHRKILTELEKAKNVKIASESMDIHIKEFPGRG